MINIKVSNTNFYLASALEKCIRPTNKEEKEALLRLLLFSEMKKNNEFNAEDLFKTHGT